MDEAELVQLLQVTRGRPLLEAQTVRKGKRKGEVYAKLRDETKANLERLGWERALTYKTLILTGLRKGGTSDDDQRKEPLTIAVNGSRKSGRLDSNQRPPEPHSGALAKLRHAPDVRIIRIPCTRYK
jgi:hypothetical protein